MRARLASWWRMRSLREQRLLLVAGALAAIVILWLGIFRPLDRALADARGRHERSVLALAEARAEAAAIRRLQRIRPAVLPASFQTHVGQLAADAGFTVARMEPVSARHVNVVINAARTQALFAWASDLERRYGLVIERLSARANSDATLAAEISIRARGR